MCSSDVCDVLASLMYAEDEDFFFFVDDVAVFVYEPLHCGSKVHVCQIINTITLRKLKCVKSNERQPQWKEIAYKSTLFLCVDFAQLKMK